MDARGLIAATSTQGGATFKEMAAAIGLPLPGSSAGAADAPSLASSGRTMIHSICKA